MRIDSAYHVPIALVANVEKHVQALTMRPRELGGYESESFEAYKLTDETLSVPRFYGQQHFGPAVDDQTCDGDAIDVQFNGTLTELQNRALAALDPNPGEPELHLRGGMLVLPCGFGKTVCALKRICDVGRRALVIVAKSFLMDQWAAQARKFTNASVGRIQRDTVELGDITIAMVQSLYSREYDVLDRFGLVVVDEAHHMAARAFSQAMWRVPAARVLGLSATPERKDGLTRLLFWSMGEIRFRAERDGAEALSVRQRVYEGGVVPDKSGRDGKINLQTMVTLLCKDEKRNRRIAQCVLDSLASGHCALVLSDRVQHLAQIEKHLKALGNDESKWYVGKTSPDERKRVEAEGRIVLSTYQMAKEGLDIQRMSCIVSFFWSSLYIFTYSHPFFSQPAPTHPLLQILATPKADVEQAVGRVQRPCPGKQKPVVEDIVDPYSIFNALRWTRARFYKRQSYPCSTLPI